MTESAPPSEGSTSQVSAALRVEDYAKVQSWAKGIVAYSLEHEWLHSIQDFENRMRAARGLPTTPPLTDRERAEGLLYRIRMYVEGPRFIGRKSA